MKNARIGLALIAFVVFDLLLAPAFYHNLTQQYAGANDFYVPWRAAQSRLIEGRDPYSADVTRDIQIGLFGRTVPPGEHQWGFAYPLYAIFMVAPFIGLPYDAAQAAWYALLLPLLFASGALILDTLGVRLRPLALAGFMLWLIALYPAARSFILGQLSIVVFACLAAAWWAAAKRRDALAGSLLALSTIKPQVVFLLVPLALLCAWQVRRRRLVLSFALTLALLLAATLALQPDWPLGFARTATAYAGYFDSPSPLQVVLPNAGLAALASGLMLLVFGLACARSVRRGWRDGWPLFGWAIIVAQLVAVHTATTNQLALLLPLLFDLARRRPYRRVRAVVAAGAFFIIPWAVFLASKEGNTEAPMALLPMSVGVALWWGWTVLREWVRQIKT
ncbi:MAG: DUF2029 domain-containing protein [Chloroflexi bacterium]|nr:DUF2029 domain-containing protein [Chloroflexota bacterium]